MDLHVVLHFTNGNQVLSSQKEKDRPRRDGLIEWEGVSVHSMTSVWGTMPFMLRCDTLKMTYIFDVLGFLMPDVLLHDLQRHCFTGTACSCSTGSPTVLICLPLKMCGAWKRSWATNSLAAQILYSVRRTNSSCTTQQQLIFSVPQQNAELRGKLKMQWQAP